MHVLLNALSAVAGGSITYLRDAVPEIAREFESCPQHRLTVLLHRSQEKLLPATFPASRIFVEGPLPKGWRRTAWERKHLAPHLAGVDLYYVPYQACYLPAHVRTVVMVRNMEPFLHWRYRYNLRKRMRNIVLYWLTARTLRAADGVIAVSDFARGHAARLMRDPKRILGTINHGCRSLFSPNRKPDDAKALSRLGVSGDFIFTSGSQLPYRRLEDVISAFAIVAKSQPQLQLVITGTGGVDTSYAEKIANALEQAGPDCRVVQLGSVSADDMAVLYRNSLVFASATEVEACPNTIIEALVSGCAIVASDMPPMREFIGDRGLYFPARRPEKAAEQILLLATNPAMRMQMKARAAELHEKYDWRNCARSTFHALTA